MANNYTVSPNIIPGNVTIGGNLNVQGDELKIGLITPFVRIAKFAPSVGLFSVNCQKDLLTRDDVASPGYALYYNTIGPRLGLRYINADGSNTNYAQRQVYSCSSVAKPIPASPGYVLCVYTDLGRGFLDKNSIVICRIWGTSQTVVGGGLTVTFTLGPTNWPTVTIGPSTNGEFDLSFVMYSQNSKAAQILQCFGSGTNVTIPPTIVNAAVDLTVSQIFQGRITLNLGTDQGTLYGMETAALNSFGPLP